MNIADLEKADRLIADLFEVSDSVVDDTILNWFEKAFEKIFLTDLQELVLRYNYQTFDSPHYWRIVKEYRDVFSNHSNRCVFLFDTLEDIRQKLDDVDDTYEGRMLERTLVGYWIQDQPELATREIVSLRARVGKYMTCINPMLPKPIESLGLRIRAQNCLCGADIRNVWELVSMNERELTKIFGLGKGCMREIKEALAKYNLSLGMF